MCDMLRRAPEGALTTETPRRRRSTDERFLGFRSYQAAVLKAEALADAPLPAAPAPGEVREDTECSEHFSRAEERAACAASFRHFLRHWVFLNRESGRLQTFATLWPGQENVVAVMEEHPWAFLLKAGKLGFTELECAFDGWVALYRTTNARVHLFSMNEDAAKALLVIVRRGLTHLPDWLGLPLMKKSDPGGDTTTSLKLYGGPDDERTIVSYPAVRNAAIDQSAQHSHVDELARMPWPEQTWSAVQSTVTPGGSIHIVSRGAGAGNYTATLYRSAKAGGSPLYPHFEPFTSRPRVPVSEIPPGADPNEVWYKENEATGMPSEQLNWLAPRTEDDAIKGSGEGAFIPESIWAACYDPGLPPILPGDRTPLVMGLDAGVTNDYFALVLVSRHPDHEPVDGYSCSRTQADPAVRAVKVWKPDPATGAIDFLEVENFVRLICLGGCVAGHPNHSSSRLSDEEGCEACAGNQRIPRHNVLQIAYDSYQLVDMAQRLSRERVAWCEQFTQGDKRLEADANLRMSAYQRKIAHPNNRELNEHIANAIGKSAPGEDTKLRIVKAAPASKIDLAVALSMATARCLYLNMKAAS